MAPDKHPIAPRVRRRQGSVELSLPFQSRVTDVWVKGCSLLTNRELTTLDKDELRSIAKKWQQRLHDFKSTYSVS